jgi:hypothetical protein
MMGARYFFRTVYSRALRFFRRLASRIDLSDFRGRAADNRGTPRSVPRSIASIGSPASAGFWDRRSPSRDGVEGNGLEPQRCLGEQSRALSEINHRRGERRK